MNATINQEIISSIIHLDLKVSNKNSDSIMFVSSFEKSEITKKI